MSYRIRDSYEIQEFWNNRHLENYLMEEGIEKQQEIKLIEIIKSIDKYRLPNRTIAFNYETLFPELSLDGNEEIHSIILSNIGLIFRIIKIHQDDFKIEDIEKRKILITLNVDLENRQNEIMRGRKSSGFHLRGVSRPHHLSSPKSINVDEDTDYYVADEDDSWIYDDNGRSANDDRSDSMNPNSHRYNP